MSDTPRTDAIADQFGLVPHPAVMAYNSLARELERELAAQIAGHKLTAKEASESATLRASLNSLHAAASRVAELHSAQYLRANGDGGRVAHAMNQMTVALASAPARG